MAPSANPRSQLSSDLNSDQQNNGLQEFLTYDRTTAARLGITPVLLNTTLNGAFGQSQVSIIFRSEFRSAEQRAPGVPDLRPHDRRKAWDHSGIAQHHAEWRLRPIAGLNYLPI